MAFLLKPFLHGGGCIRGDGVMTPSVDSGADAFEPSVLRLLDAADAMDLQRLVAVLADPATGTVNSHGGAFMETALHKVVMKDWSEGVKVLLANGAKVYAKNHFGQTPLHYASARQSLECTKILLKGGLSLGASAALNHQDSRGRTPLHDGAECACVEVIKLLLKAGASVNIMDKNNETPLHKAAKAYSVPAMLALLNGGANLIARDSKGVSVLIYILGHAGGLEALFDNCLDTNTDQKSKNLEVTFNFVPCISTSNSNQMRCLRNIVEYGHANLLKHPLCQTFLLMKWFQVRKFFYIQFVLYIFCAILTTVLTLNKFYESENKSTYITQYDNLTTLPVTNQSDVLSTESVPGFLHKGLKITFQFIVLLQFIIITFQLILTPYYSGCTFKFSMPTVMHVIICFLVFLVLPFDNVEVWQRHLATILLLLLWTQCMLLVGKIPACGIYVVMFTTVAKLFMRIFFVYVSLLLAFTFSFQLALNMETGQNLIISSLQTLTMMIGELDFDESFIESLSLLPGTSHIIFVLFVILVAIILSNLLVALAVSDVQSLRTSAQMERLIKQMELVFEMEQTFSGLYRLTKNLKMLKFCSVFRRVCYYDIKKTRVYMKPYDFQKSNILNVAVEGKNYEEKVPKALTSSVLNCLRVREEAAMAPSIDKKQGDGQSKRKLGRIKSTEYNNRDDLEQVFRQLETTIGDIVCARLDIIVAANNEFSERLAVLERILTRGNSDTATDDQLTCEEDKSNIVSESGVVKNSSKGSQGSLNSTNESHADVETSEETNGALKTSEDNKGETVVKSRGHKRVLKSFHSCDHHDVIVMKGVKDWGEVNRATLFASTSEQDLCNQSEV